MNTEKEDFHQLELRTHVRECTYGWGDVEAADVGSRPVVDFTLRVESPITVVSGAAPHTVPVSQAVQIGPVPTVMWVSKDNSAATVIEIHPPIGGV